MLQDESSLRLVVLNACEGARSSHVDPFSGVAASLVNFDIPAVIGMQFEITDAAAIAFSQSLYTGLARGLPIDTALAPARRAIIGAMLATEFATPVLFLRDGDARLFDIADAPAEIPVVIPAAAPMEAAAVEEVKQAPAAAPIAVPVDGPPAVDGSSAPARGTRPFVISIALAWIAAALLALTVGASFLRMGGGGLGIAITAPISQILAVTVLALHYVTRPRRSWVPTAGYAVAAGVSVFAMIRSALDYYDQGIQWAFILYGVVLILVGAWLTWAGRRKVSPYAASLRAPAYFVIAAGAAEVLAQGVWLAQAFQWMEVANWIWALAVLGLALGYAISASLLARESKVQRDNSGRGVSAA